MAKSNLARYQFRPTTPVIVRQTRVVKVKSKRRRGGGGGAAGSWSDLAIAAAAAMWAVGSFEIPIFVKDAGEMGTLAIAAHFMKANKHLKGIQQATLILAVAQYIGTTQMFSGAKAVPGSLKT